MVEGVRDDEVVAARRGRSGRRGSSGSRSGRRGRRGGRGRRPAPPRARGGPGGRPTTRREAEAPKPSRGGGLGGGRREGRVGSKAEVVVRAERQHGPAADVGLDARAARRLGAGAPAVDGGERLELGLQHGAERRARSGSLRARLFHVEQSHVDDDLIERRAGRRSRLVAVGRARAGASAVVSTKTRPPGPDQPRAQRQPLLRRQRRPRDRDVERPRPAGAIAWATASPRADPHRDAVAKAELADRRAQERRLLGDRLDTARPSARAQQRQRDRRQAAAAADVDHARRLRRACRASANASGKCSATSTAIERAAVRLMRAFQRSSDSA